MGKKKSGKSKKKDKAKKAHAKGKLPKRKCCMSKPRCSRCPLVALKAGTLPEGYTVRHRQLVKIAGHD
ncbi:hypothetical protein EK0264_10105 [Epidermidibacterium keratini]|uniref:Uncharacterized protein n=1 Tax=Epidermidibacterium keratini TaxID=1891644 RepID=A0A7L4YPX6_9ACTN|nr:hypothetical protein [Epidermidibacterium keratini]QHC00607.1 hypothetical protein EK0264_10105 [Epidermidibacterium keratini]